MIQKILLYINTIARLKSTQLFGQLTKKYRLNSVYYGKINSSNIARLHLFIYQLDEDSSYLSRFNTEQILNNDICLLNEHHKLNLSDWIVNASPLWRFNLQYFEYCIPLGINYEHTKDIKYYEKFKSFINSWINVHDVKDVNAWHPYTISMRIPVWLICMDLFEEQIHRDLMFKEKIYESIYLQYSILQIRQETWQLGNHYLENLKTIVFCSLLFNEKDIYIKYVKKLLAELKEEILGDGLHFELSPMYHRIILEDLIRLCYVSQQLRLQEYEDLKHYVQLMTNAMYSLEKGAGRIPLFNDSGEEVAKSKFSLLRTVEELFSIAPHEVSLHESAYHKLHDQNMTVIFDTGSIGPTYMPGHGHCDCLSFELFYDGKPIFVNSGTYKYQGELRNYFRATHAHNTVAINGHEQSEIWGEHRVARRVSVLRSQQLSLCEVTAECMNYHGEKHTRSVKLKENCFEIIDETTGSGQVCSYLHLAPDLKYSNGKIQGAGVNITVSAINTSVDVTESLYSPAFGLIEKNICLVFTWNNDKQKHGYLINFEEGEVS